MAKPRRRFSRYLAGVSATFLLAVLHAPLSAAEDEQPPWTICEPYPYGPNGQYAENSTFESNIKLLAASLPRNASSSPALYATGSVGDVPYMVYGQALCCGDVSNASACESCVSTAFRSAQQACPLYKDAMIFYDLCQIQFSSRNFFVDNDYNIPTYTLQRSRLVDAPASAFDTAVELLVNATVDHAVGDSSTRFGTGEEGFYDRSSPKIYALSQCAPDRTADVCRTCLGFITARLPGSFSGRTGGGVFGVWCNFRYEVYPFFSGRPLLQLPQFVEEPPASAAPPAIRGGERTRNRTGKVLAIVVPTIVVILATTVVYFFCWKKRRPQADGFLPPTSDDIQHIDSLLLDLATLRVATDDFEESKMLGKGGFGMVYKGVLLDGQEIAVKRLGKTSRQGIEELKSELVLVAKLHHKNLVKLFGFCLEEHERILVYEYMPNRSLDTILFDFEKKTELDWGKRFKIINGIARALQYLHEDSQPKIIHRDLKASNILLDFDYTPKISDFGLAKIFGCDQSEDVTRRIAGTYGYMAPEYAMRGQYSIKSDVFSFGVLVLEIVTGRRISGPYNTEKDIDLLNLVWENWTRGSVIELIDPSLSNHPPVDQILKCIHLGLLCVQRKPASRPTMSSVNIMFSSHTVRLPSLPGQHSASRIQKHIRSQKIYLCCPRTKCRSRKSRRDECSLFGRNLLNQLSTVGFTESLHCGC